METEVYSHINGRLNIKVNTGVAQRTYTLFLDKVRGYTGDKVILLREDTLKRKQRYKMFT